MGRVLRARCRFCGHDNPHGSNFCNDCGAPLHLQPCQTCDGVDRRGASHCHGCGTAFADESVPADDSAACDLASDARAPDSIKAPGPQPPAASSGGVLTLRASAAKKADKHVNVAAVATLLCAIGAGIYAFPHARSSLLQPGDRSMNDYAAAGVQPSDTRGPVRVEPPSASARESEAPDSGAVPSAGNMVGSTPGLHPKMAGKPATAQAQPGAESQCAKPASAERLSPAHHRRRAASPTHTSRQPGATQPRAPRLVTAMPSSRRVTSERDPASVSATMTGRGSSLPGAARSKGDRSEANVGGQKDPSNVDSAPSPATPAELDAGPWIPPKLYEGRSLALPRTIRMARAPELGDHMSAAFNASSH